MEIIKALQEILEPKAVLQGEDVKARPNLPWGQGQCPAKALVRPANTEQLSKVMALCHEHGQTVVPWGGLTGLVNGTMCTADDIALSLERMNAIESIDEDAGTMTAQAGVVLQRVQEEAEAQGWHFALDLGARGSATIGGNIATNAGGNAVVRYGMMREQILGLEVVLPDGTVLSSMNAMLKNNAGYDLKHLFIGSEGTLGIVTRAVLRLRPMQHATQTALVALTNFAEVVELLRRLGVDLEGKLSAFEVMWNTHYRLLVEESNRHPTFLPTNYPYYVLIKSCGADRELVEQHFTTELGNLLEEGCIANAVIAQSGRQADQLWEMRDDVEALVLALNPLAAFDVSLPIRDMESYVADVERELASRWPGTRVVTFGHLGDGNIHLCVGPVQDRHGVRP